MKKLYLITVLYSTIIAGAGELSAKGTFKAMQELPTVGERSQVASSKIAEKKEKLYSGVQRWTP